MDELPGRSQSTSNEIELTQKRGREMRTLASDSDSSDLPELLSDLSNSKDSGRNRPLHNKTGQRLCQICFGLDEEAFKDQTNYSMLCTPFIQNQKCKTCSLLQSSISKFEPLWVEKPSEIPWSNSEAARGAGRTIDKSLNVSLTAEDGLIVSISSLKVELYRRLGTLYLIREHVSVYFFLRALLIARTLLPKKSKRRTLLPY